jgi:hypothetical protein
MTAAQEIALDAYTTLALALDAAMLKSASARAAYKATYGYEWVSLASAEAVKSCAPLSGCATVC